MYGVSLFAGAGGPDLAASERGIECVGYENWAPAVATRHAAGLITRAEDVSLADPYDPQVEHAQLLMAGPPCQSFSATGGRSGSKQKQDVIDAVLKCNFQATFEDDRTRLVLEPLRWIVSRVMVENPFQWIFLEQVPDVLEIWYAYADVLRPLGYSVDCEVLDAFHFGTGQTRTRAILAAKLNGRVVLPQPDPFHSHVGFAEKLGLGEGDWTLVSNNTSAAHRDKRGVRHSPAPSFTLTGRCSRMHIVEGHIDPPKSTKGLGRPITIPECGVLQGFDRRFPWRGSNDDRSQQIGNACPVPLAKVVLDALLDY